MFLGIAFTEMRCRPSSTPGARGWRSGRCSCFHGRSLHPSFSSVLGQMLWHLELLVVGQDSPSHLTSALSPLSSFLLPAFPPFLFHAHVFLLRPRPKLPLQYPGPRLELGSYPGAHTLHPALMPVLGSIYPADTSTPLTCGL